MHNWSTDENSLKKNPEAHAIWKLEQLVNFGLDGERLKISELKKYWSRLKLDPARKRFLELLLHDS
ncbi:MAG: hypothetical protein HYV34_01955 [Candidatus Kerfeldbacteria bacterium]|nr:hypothetical protein [Candidatus Kerfeldbacteria bacterium]